MFQNYWVWMLNLQPTVWVKKQLKWLQHLNRAKLYCSKTCAFMPKKKENHVANLLTMLRKMLLRK